MNDIELFNRLARHVRPAFQEYVPIESLDIEFPETGLDSMDGLMMLIYLCDIYGVDDETSKTISYTNPKELLAKVREHKKRDPQSVDEAMEWVK